jgi:hypothetical protein
MGDDWTSRRATLISLLSDLSGSRRPWIARKEVAAWSAALLYFAILLGVSNLLGGEGVSISAWYTVVFMLLLLPAFALFIHTQFGSYAYEVATQKVINRWAFILLQRTELPREFTEDIPPGGWLPAPMQQEIHNQVKDIRGHCFLRRLLVPIRFVFLKSPKRQEIGALELQEAIIYILMAVLTAGVLLAHHVLGV